MRKRDTRPGAAKADDDLFRNAQAFSHDFAAMADCQKLVHQGAVIICEGGFAGDAGTPKRIAQGLLADSKLICDLLQQQAIRSELCDLRENFRGPLFTCAHASHQRAANQPTANQNGEASISPMTMQRAEMPSSSSPGWPSASIVGSMGDVMGRWPERHERRVLDKLQLGRSASPCRL